MAVVAAVVVVRWRCSWDKLLRYRSDTLERMALSVTDTWLRIERLAPLQ